MKNNSSRLVIILVVTISIIVIGIIGLSFAVFSSSDGNKEYNTIATGKISMTYTEAVNGISITNAFLTTDEAGKKLSGDKQYFDFTVDTVIEGDAEIEYDIAAIKGSNSSIDDDDIRLYLEQQKSGTYSSLMEPSKFISISKESKNGSPKNSMILATVKKNESEIDNYRLRMWLADSAQLDDNEQTFAVKINVYAKS